MSSCARSYGLSCCFRICGIWIVEGHKVYVANYVTGWGIAGWFLSHTVTVPIRFSSSVRMHMKSLPGSHRNSRGQPHGVFARFVVLGWVMGWVD